MKRIFPHGHTKILFYMGGVAGRRFFPPMCILANQPHIFYQSGRCCYSFISLRNRQKKERERGVPKNVYDAPIYKYIREKEPPVTLKTAHNIQRDIVSHSERGDAASAVFFSVGYFPFPPSLSISSGFSTFIVTNRDGQDS